MAVARIQSCLVVKVARRLQEGRGGRRGEGRGGERGEGQRNGS